MLDRRGVQRVADLFVNRDPFLAFVAEYADLDELMSGEVNLDLGEHGVSQAFRADEHDRFECMCLGAQLDALVGGDFEGGHVKWETRLKWRHLRSPSRLSTRWSGTRLGHCGRRRARTTESRITAGFLAVAARINRVLSAKA
jgi:hypothetical protein